MSLTTIISARPNAHVALLLLALIPALACGDGDGGAQRSDADRAVIPDPAFPAVDDSDIVDGASANWPSHGGGALNQRYSPLDQIQASNVSGLVPVWIYSTGIEGAFETTPIVVDNTMYLTTARGRVVALNAATGRELWTFDPAPETVTLCCGPTNGGVAAYGSRVYVATLDARLVALDARTGQLAWEQRLADPGAGYSIVMAPLAVAGRVFVGVTGERYGVRGFMAALDASSGEEVWRWHSIPQGSDTTGWWGEWSDTDPFGAPLGRDLAAERADSFATRSSWNVGGGGIATTPAYDPETGYLYVNVEGPAPLVDASVRPGDNLYTGSIVALDSRSGQRVWHTQYLPHDQWGLSGGSPPFLFDRGDDRYVAFAGRTGWLYVFDAGDGRPILRSDNFVPQEGLFTAPSPERAVRMAPGANGGNSGTGVAYDPGSGVAFVGGVHQPMVYQANPEPYRQGQLWLGGSVRFPPGEEQWGTVTAIDLEDGAITWQRKTPAPVHSALLATAGGVVFAGQGSGTLDAFDARTGELLWQFNTGAGVHGGPVTYSVGGVQYVVVPAGGSTHFDTSPGDDVLAFALVDARPASVATDYEATSYQRGGPATAGTAGVHQARRDSAPADSARAGTIPPDTPPADTADSVDVGGRPR